jgi:hypothetical protein
MEDVVLHQGPFGMSKKIILASLVCLLSPLRAAERVGHKPNAGAVARVEWCQLTGYVEARDLAKHTLRIRDRNGNVAHITVDENVQIFRDWRLIALNDVNVEDHLIIKRSNGLQ